MEETLWVEKYRPKTIDECILPDSLSVTFSKIVENIQKKPLGNMLFAGTAGVGKTTVAKALCRELDLDWILINGSEENGIDVLRNKIKQFASSISMQGGVRVVILDEAEYLTVACQTALRGFIEEFSANCRFILTCNFKNRIIEPLHSRCSVIEFNTSKKDLATLAAKFHGRLKDILTKESIKYDNKTLAELIIRYAPDWRRVINECQRFAVDGEIPSSILTGTHDDFIKEVVGYLKEKDFKSMRAWVANNSSSDPTVIFRKIYDGLSEYANPNSIPAAVMIIGEWSHKTVMAPDKEIPVVCCLTELMTNVEWKK